MKKVFRFIGMIFKGIWKLINFTRLAIVNLFFFAMIAVFYFALTQSDAPAKVETKASALVMNLSGPIVEQSTYVNPMDSFTGSLFGQDLPKENVLFDVVDTIRHASQDEKVTGLVLSLRDMPETSLTKLRYIAKAINEFKATGKPVYAYGAFYNQSQYYLASYADKVYLAPDGAVLVKGYSAYSMYFKTLLEKLDVTTHVFRVGTYKSAVEPFLRDDMSEDAKANATRWVGQLWGAYVDDVSTNREIAPGVLTPSMDDFLASLKKVDGDLAALSKEMGLVDELATKQQVNDAMVEEFGSDGDGGFNAVGYYEYLASVPFDFPDNPDSQVAVVVASGSIMDGEQPRGTIGGDTTAALLKQAREDDSVKSVVLRVDSPGGSAFASEVIRNEVQALKDAGKPVVVSMSSVAASGGYWISMSASQIMAQPTTITGSIGIFSVITTFEKGLNNIGVNTDGVGTTPFSGVGITRGINEGASQAFQMGIEHGYKRFISLVSDNRDMSVTEVDDVAQGRVWTGQDALDHGLIDKIGDFDDAIALAAELASLEQYDVMFVEEPLSPAQQFVQDLMKQVHVSLGLDISSWIPQSLLPVANELKQHASLMESFNDPKGHYVLCLTCNVQ
ncbi:signal peptide peptidase SppA [Vibrio sp. SCSIO 43140]|uniref:signal peptide peptidase SppA n=1 Tax=Vibrio sp. SCSIO 43140 TaxID=2819100 RepID=UPI002074FEF3|nr:signal peptide peptidase SppA [Vibrio sp. SCSIO 43140]USD61265.1 signal peptide peptidase SppA [Vibrio sp. SCSIO 43140]